MRPSTILSLPWWPPFTALRNTVMAGRTVSWIHRNDYGELFHAKPASKINGFVIDRQPVWSLDFQQEWDKDNIQYHIENIKVANSPRYIVFQCPNTPWQWNPNLGVCGEVVLSLRIGGYLVDAWHFSSGELTPFTRDGFLGGYKMAAQSPVTKLCPEITVATCNVGPHIHKQQIVDFTLSTFHVLTSHTMVCPARISRERYQDNHKTLLLDWAKCENQNVAILKSKFS